jgi:hypothetical protein
MKVVLYILWHGNPLLGNDREISNDMTDMSEELTASGFKVGGKPNKQKQTASTCLSTGLYSSETSVNFNKTTRRQIVIVTSDGVPGLMAKQSRTDRLTLGAGGGGFDVG